VYLPKDKKSTAKMIWLCWS